MNSIGFRSYVETGNKHLLKILLFCLLIPHWLEMTERFEISQKKINRTEKLRLLQVMNFVSMLVFYFVQC